MAKDKRLVIGIDFGTGSSKGVLARLNGKVIATSEKAHRTSMPKPGHVEHDADEVWWADFLAITHDLLHKAEAHASSKSIEPNALLQARLFPDMFALSRQVQIAADFARGVSARARGCVSTGQ